jgi:hypothetical protein
MDTEQGTASVYAVAILTLMAGMAYLAAHVVAAAFKMGGLS